MWFHRDKRQDVCSRKSMSTYCYTIYYTSILVEPAVVIKWKRAEKWPNWSISFKVIQILQ